MSGLALTCLYFCRLSFTVIWTALLVEHVQKIREQIEQLNREIEAAQRSYDLNKAAELQYGRLPQFRSMVDHG